MRIEFSKYEALGNDFIVVDESQDEKHKTEPSVQVSLRRLMCQRKLGIGADGVITLLPPLHEGSDVFMHVTNADGSVPENCGNGLRCVARYLRDAGRIQEDRDFVIDALSGPKKARVVGETIQVELGLARVSPEFENARINTLCEGFAQRHKSSTPKVLAFVDLGNPHLILECDAIEAAQVELGPKLEKLSLFPNGANVSFVRQESQDTIALRTWERGAGATDACGSGACASVAAFLAFDKINAQSRVLARFAHGAVTVLSQQKSVFEYEMHLSGTAQKLFAGVWESSESVCG